VKEYFIKRFLFNIIRNEIANYLKTEPEKQTDITNTIVDKILDKFELNKK
jgi:hypothetical protein